MDEDKERYLRARARVKRLKQFYKSILSFIFVNILLVIINLITNPHHLWFYWVTIIWGAVLIVQAFNIFTIRDVFLGDEWEEKKIRKLMEKDKKDSSFKE